MIVETALLLSAMAGLLVAAWFAAHHLEDPPESLGRWVGPFAASGGALGAAGLGLLLTGPLQGGHALLFGAPAFGLGALLVAAAVSCHRGETLDRLGPAMGVGGVLSLALAGAVAVRGLTAAPGLAALGFGATGVALIAPAALSREELRRGGAVAAVAAALLLGLAGAAGAVSPASTRAVAADGKEVRAARPVPLAEKRAKNTEKAPKRAPAAKPSAATKPAAKAPAARAPAKAPAARAPGKAPAGKPAAKAPSAGARGSAARPAPRPPPATPR